MKLPTLQQAGDALAALGSIAGHGESVAAAASAVNIIVDLFDQPSDQDALKVRYAEARKRTDAALDRLDAAIADREKSG